MRTTSDPGSVLEADPNTFHDPATGSTRRRGEPLRSAVQLADPPPPAPAPPPIVAPGAIKALASRAAALEKCHGSLQGQGTHAAHLEASESLELLRIVAPAVAARIDADLLEVHRLESRAAQANADAVGIVHRLENSLRFRAALLRQIDDHKAELESARATLETLSCLEMDPGELLKVELTRKHLPAKIASLQTQADAAAATIKDLLAHSEIDGKALLAHMEKSAGPPPGAYYAADPALVQLFKLGHLALP